MIEFEEARKRIFEKVKRLGALVTATVDTLDSILAEDLKAGYDFPPFDKSAVDGYAARSQDIKKAPVKLKCRGIIKAGEFGRKKIRKGECIKIMTGAPVPEGADCVVMVEDTGGNVEILRSIKKQANLCLMGEDVRKGAVILKKGTIMRGPEISIASGLGRKKIKVFRKPSVAVLNTGDEVTEPGEALTKGRIFNNNGPMLMGLLRGLNIDAEYLGVAADRRGSLENLIKKGLKKDFFIITGGVSVGDYDFVPGVLKKFGTEKILHGIRIKPGKPVYFGRRGKTFIFGAPGNPVATFVSFILFIKPALEKMSGKTPDPGFRKGILKDDFSHKPGRKHFYPARIVEKNGKYSVYPVKGYSGSADIYSLKKANAFMIVDGKIKSLKKGITVEFLLW